MTAITTTTKTSAPWIERISGPVSLIGVVLLLCLLGGDLVVLIVANPAPDWVLVMLRAGPVAVFILGVFANVGTLMRWLRIVFRRERLQVEDEAKGIVEDRIAGALGDLDDRLRQHPEVRRGCQEALRGCAPRLALTLLVATTLTVVATLGPSPVLAVQQGPTPGGTTRAVPSATAMAIPTPTLVPTLTPVLPGHVTEFAVPTPGSVPMRIVTGPDGNLWFTEQGANQIGRITP
jgi:hypothetical protein